MTNWRAAYLIIGAILCLAGAVADAGELLILGSAFAASAGLQYFIRASAGNSQPDITRASQRPRQSAGEMSMPGAESKP